MGLRLIPPIIFALLIFFAVRIIIVKRWYAQALLLFVAIAGILSVFSGVEAISGGSGSSGPLLLGIGLLTLLATAVVIKLLYFSVQNAEANQSLQSISSRGAPRND